MHSSPSCHVKRGVIPPHPILSHQAARHRISQVCGCKLSPQGDADLKKRGTFDLPIVGWNDHLFDVFDVGLTLQMSRAPCCRDGRETVGASAPFAC
jgi:hypothetical protein